MTPKKIRPASRAIVGDHLYHDSGEYLGVVVGTAGPVLKFKGGRSDAAESTFAIATVHESYVGSAPVASSK